MVLLVAGFLAATTSPLQAQEPTEPDVVELVMFYGDGCPHCANEKVFLESLQQRYPDLHIETYEVWNDDVNLELFRQFAADHGVEARGVPTTFVAGQTWTGFSNTTGDHIETVVAALIVGLTPTAQSPTDVDVPGIGSIDIGGRSMLVATLLIGFADGMNPCSLWALSILLALVLHSHSRARVMIVGSIFLIVTSALYGAYMIGAYSALDYAGGMTWIRAIIAAVAGGFGLVHLGSYLTGKRSALSIPESRKPSMYRRMRSLADPDRSLRAVVGGTVILAIGVSLLETPCTAGLPLLWADMLAERNISAGGTALLFSVYLGVFLLDELVLFTLAVVTLRATKLQESHGRLLHLVSGSLMTTLAAAMIFDPHRLETVSGTLLVFAASIVLAALLAAIRHLKPQVHSTHPV